MSITKVVTTVILGKALYLMILIIYQYVTNGISFFACLSSSLQCMIIAYPCFTLTALNRSHGCANLFEGSKSC